MDYLVWYRKVLKLPIQNQTRLLEIVPQEGYFKLRLSKGELAAYKVVLATGRAGFGGVEVPEWIRKLPKSRWAHTNELIDFAALKDKRVAIIGGGDSGFDAARIALDHHAKSADLFIRRPALPNTNPARELFFRGCFAGYYDLPDEEKWKIYCHIFDKGTTPPRETLERISKYQKFHFHANTDVEPIKNQFDYFILGCGLAIDGSKQPELKTFIDDVLLWKDKGFTDHPKLGRSPYLGPHFEFIEKKKGKAPYLKDIHCFNYGSTLSHSGLGTEIPPMPFGAERLAEGIASDFLYKDWQKHYEKFKAYNDPEFRPEEFSFFSSSQSVRK
jgi:cation diffusion facilitator CzcD-associated flavoprotein CzcO